MMETFKDLWPIIQAGALAAFVVMYLWLRDAIKDRNDLATKNDELVTKFIALSNSATAIIEKNTAATASESDLIRRWLEERAT